MLSANNLRADKNRLASEWQQSTRGVTYAPPLGWNRPFKTLRLNDRIAEINTVVFGSSTTMSITKDAFPPPLRSYNFAQSSNSLRSVIGEAEYVVERWGDRMVLLVIPLDWALGFVYERGEPLHAELSRDSALAYAAASRPSLFQELKDALSLPRLEILVGILREALAAPDTGARLRQIFMEPAGAEYRCPDGTPARDFDVVYRGICTGFRDDGSATFANEKRLDANRAPAALAMAVTESSQYAEALRRSQGQLNSVLLERLAHLARQMEARGGALVLLLPPLLPGLEEALTKTPHSGAWLRATKDALESWSVRENIALLDAGRSERYRCVAAEFIDSHHAMPECYRKAVTRFFLDHPRILAAVTARSR
jgi:hypothetical protein